MGEASDESTIAAACRGCGWSVHFAATIDQARKLLVWREYQIVLLDRDLPGDKWREAMALLVTASSPSCILLVSKVIDDYLWNEVVHNGGYDVLAKPLRAQEVTRAVRLAWSYRMSAGDRAERLPRV